MTMTSRRRNNNGGVGATATWHTYEQPSQNHHHGFTNKNNNNNNNQRQSLGDDDDWEEEYNRTHGNAHPNNAHLIQQRSVEQMNRYKKKEQNGQQQQHQPSQTASARRFDQSNSQSSYESNARSIQGRQDWGNTNNGENNHSSYIPRNNNSSNNSMTNNNHSRRHQHQATSFNNNSHRPPQSLPQSSSSYNQSQQSSYHPPPSSSYSSNNNNNNNNTKIQLRVLYTHQKTKKKKSWKDGRLTLSSLGHCTLYDACPIPGSSSSSGGGQIDTLELTRHEATSIRNSVTNGGGYINDGELESEKYLIQIESVWDVDHTRTNPGDGGGGLKGSSNNNPLWNKQPTSLLHPIGGTKNISSYGMKKLL